MHDPRELLDAVHAHGKTKTLTLLAHQVVPGAPVPSTSALPNAAAPPSARAAAARAASSSLRVCAFSTAVNASSTASAFWRTCSHMRTLLGGFGMHAVELAVRVALLALP